MYLSSCPPKAWSRMWSPTPPNSAELHGRDRLCLAGFGLPDTFRRNFHYDGPSDSVAWTERGTNWTRDIAGIGGELAAVQESGGTTFDLTELHGDVVASASSSPTATKLLATYRFDEFGEPVSGSAGRFGWLGGKLRRTELQSGVIQMGARSYSPQLGRFLSSDPVTGGSANAYDYVDQNPVNTFDLEGTCIRNKPGGKCAGGSAGAAGKQHPPKNASTHRGGGSGGEPRRPPASQVGPCTIHPSLSHIVGSVGSDTAYITGNISYSCSEPVEVRAFYIAAGGTGPISGLHNPPELNGSLPIGMKFRLDEIGSLQYCVLLAGANASGEKCGQVVVIDA